LFWKVAFKIMIKNTWRKNVNCRGEDAYIIQ
jgi:hypothetical protein